MTINALRLTFLFTETILDTPGQAGAWPLKTFCTRSGYIQTVDALSDGAPAPLGLIEPWPYPAGQHFWSAYLHDKQPGDADGRLFFDKLLPLRLPQLAEKLEATLPEDPEVVKRLTAEGFYYPFGTALVVTVNLEGEFDAAKTGSLAMAVRHDKVYRLTMPGGQQSALLNLAQLATVILDQIRVLGFGAGRSGSRNRMFSIATVIRGTDVDPDKPVEPDSETHRLLNGLTSWVRDWEHLPAPALQQNATQLQIKKATARSGNIMFAAKHGRAVWFPGRFLPKPTSAHSLACYHRNLGLASLQTEALIMLASAVEDYCEKNILVPNALRQLGQLAGGLLGRLYSGAKTYKSDSIRAQIQQSEQLADINSLRMRLEMKAIP